MDGKLILLELETILNIMDRSYVFRWSYLIGCKVKAGRWFSYINNSI